MRAFQALAGVVTRLVLVPLLTVVLGCGGGTEPPDTAATGARGLWNAALTTSGQLPGGQRVTCTIAWAMTIDDPDTPGGPDLLTFTPLTTGSSATTAPTSHGSTAG